MCARIQPLRVGTETIRKLLIPRLLQGLMLVDMTCIENGVSNCVAMDIVMEEQKLAHRLIGDEKKEKRT